MGRNFSLLTLLLIVTLGAFGAASIRIALGHNRLLAPDMLAAWLVGGAFVGLAFGFAVTAWSRGPSLMMLVTPVFGLAMGTAAAAQMTVRIDWPAMIALPALVVGIALVVGWREQRRLRSAPRPKQPEAHPCDLVSVREVL